MHQLWDKIGASCSCSCKNDSNAIRSIPEYAPRWRRTPRRPFPHRARRPHMPAIPGKQRAIGVDECKWNRHINSTILHSTQTLLYLKLRLAAPSLHPATPATFWLALSLPLPFSLLFLLLLWCLWWLLLTLLCCSHVSRSLSACWTRSINHKNIKKIKLTIRLELKFSFQI